MTDRPVQWRGRLEDAELVAREFPALAGALARPETRRRVLRLMAASVALGGLAACDPSAPDGHYVPAVKPAPGIVPGLPNRYATAMIDGGAAAGLVVTHRMGRPIKVDGNPHHPASLGATSLHGQGLILDFYDPDRAAGVLQDATPATWQDLQKACLAQQARLARTRGAGLRVMTGRVLSPTLGAALDDMLRAYPEARLHQWEGLSRDNVTRGASRAYGRPFDLVPDLAATDVLLALDSDLISGAPGHLRYARDFAGRRNPVRGSMSRVYAAEPVPTLAGGAADHRFIASPREIEAITEALAASLLDGTTPTGAPGWITPVAADLRRAGSRALVHAGPDLPAEMHALVHRINERLGGRGHSYRLIEPVAWRPEDEAASLATLIADMQAGRVGTLLILEGNPVYAAPGFREALARVPFSLHSAAAPNETTRAVHWSVPGTHLFEMWGDARAHDGTLSIQQPQALPLYGGHDAFEVLSLFHPDLPTDSRAAIRQAWRHLDDDAWLDALAAGVVPGTASGAASDARLQPASPPAPSAPPAPHDLILLTRPDPNLLDGRHANNPWLQELPRPVGKIVWENPLLLAPATARRLGLANGDEAQMRLGARRRRVPVWTVPGQSEAVAVMWLGGGRESAGAVGNGVGTDIMDWQGLDGALEVVATGQKRPVASTDHHNMLDVTASTVDQIVRHGTLAAFEVNPGFLHEGDDNPSIFHQPQKDGTAWGMSIDLNACIGCNACVVACQAENNVPVVGREQVLIGREMHWLRIDRYFEGPDAAPDSYLQPMLCMHCEDAPCEPVCPVEASIHDSEGLNLQVYNRCIGTRFCSNNCPYKVRRFNFGAWAAEEARPPVARNPEVTVRSRGVMEKCTFCVQRIAQARIEHDRDGRKETTVTACQAACPTQAFSFGDINDAASEVARHKRSPLDYALLAEQNTFPRVTYEARIRNRNPDIAS